MSQFIRYVPLSISGGGGGLNVTSLNTLTGALTLSSTTLTIASPDSSTITVDLTKGNLTEATSSVLTITGGTGAVLGSGSSIQVKQSSTSQSGYLSSTDWNTFNGKQPAGNYITALTGDITAAGPGSAASTLATVNSNVGSFTLANFTVNAKGLVTAASTTAAGNLTDVGTDGITVTGGTGAVIGSGTSIAQHVADSTHNGYLSSTDWSTFNSKQAALTIGNLTDAGTDGITVTGGTGAVIGSGTSIAQRVADTTHNGYLSSTDWNTFNGKQASGNYITALTGDISASGPGSAASTLATVNSNVGAFGSSTAIPTLTVNGKGLVTAASTSAVIAPAGTLTGTTLNATVVTSSLTTVGTIGTGTWQGTTVATGFGGTGVTSVTTAPAASSFAGWDANKNLSANNLIDGFRTQATANGTLTLVIGDAGLQFFTGTTAGQIVKLPTTGIVAGGQYTLVNSSSQTIAVQSSGSNAILTIAAGFQAVLTALVATPTTAANWSYAYSSANNASPPTGTVTSVTFTGDGTILSSTPSSAVTTSGTVTASLNTQTANKFLAGPTSGGAATPTFRVLATADFVAPTVTTLTSGTGTYTTPTSPRAPLYIEIEMCGGGGGGSGGGTAPGSGGSGTASTFGSSLLVADGGAGGTGGGNAFGGAGGTASLGTGPVGVALTGSTGNGSELASGSTYGMGGGGGMSVFGGAPGSTPGGSTGAAAATNSGSGGSGGGSGTVPGIYSGSGGGAGGYVDAIITSPSATYSYAVGPGGAGGAAGASGAGGGAGGDGIIIIKEYYQ